MELFIYKLHVTHENDLCRFKMSKNGVEFGQGYLCADSGAPLKLQLSSLHLRFVPDTVKAVSGEKTHITTKDGKEYAKLVTASKGVNLLFHGDKRYKIVDGGYTSKAGYAFKLKSKNLALLQKIAEVKNPPELWQEVYEMTSATQLPDDLAMLMLTFPLYRRDPFHPTSQIPHHKFVDNIKESILHPKKHMIKSLLGFGLIFWAIAFYLLARLGFTAYMGVQQVLYNHRMSDIELNEVYQTSGEAITAYDLDKGHFVMKYLSTEYQDAAPDEVRYILMYSKEVVRSSSYYYGMGGGKSVSTTVETADVTLVDRTTGEIISEDTIGASLPDKIDSNKNHIKEKLSSHDFMSWASKEIREYSSAALTG